MSSWNSRDYSGYENLGNIMRNAPEIMPREVKAGQMKESTMNLYDSLINLVLNHKMELKKIPATSNINSAQQWIRDHGKSKTHEARIVDLNNDGVNDVVIYSRKTGKPVVINGYSLAKSDWGARNEYYKNHGAKESRIDESYSDWTTGQFYDTVVDQSNPFKQRVNIKKQYEKYADDGWSLPKRPNEKISPYNLFCKLIAPAVQEWKANDLPAFIHAINPNGNIGESNLKFFNQIVSPITLYRVLYNKLILRTFWLSLERKEQITDLDHFNNYIKKNSRAVENIFIKNFLFKDDTGKLAYPFRLNARITNRTVNDALILCQVNTDESDYNDSLVFLLGGKTNLSDENFVKCLSIKSFADDFLARCRASGSSRKSQEYKVAKKQLTKWKDIATKRARKYMTTEFDKMMNSEDAKAIFNVIADNGGNVADQSIEGAMQNQKQFEHAPVPKTTPSKVPLPPTPIKVLTSPFKSHGKLSDAELAKQSKEFTMNIMELQDSGEDVDNTLRSNGYNPDKFLHMVDRLRKDGMDTFDFEEFKDTQFEELFNSFTEE